MKIMVVGLGSMGKRRIRLIRDLYPECCIIGVDGRSDRRQCAESEYAIRCVGNIEDIEDTPECAFVCTSPLSHAAVISKCLSLGCHVFSEINLISDGYDENIALAKDKGVTLFLSSTFLYREETRYISDSISKGKKYNYVYHIGQYLPDWHPWENYKDFFVGDKRTNGCREILAIELPWITRCFGRVIASSSVSDRLTGLNISYDDNYMIMLTHENGNKGVLIVDVVSPVAVRKLEAYTEGEYISWDGSPDSIKKFDPKTGQAESISLSEEAEHIDGYRTFIVENAYRNEIKAFFDVVDGARPVYDFESDKEIISLIDSIEAEYE